MPGIVFSLPKNSSDDLKCLQWINEIEKEIYHKE